MATRDILTAPHPALSAVAEEVGDADRRQLIDDMLETMFVADGTGLAATQVGVAERVAVVNIDPAGDGVRTTLALVDPVVTAEGDPVWGREGCLSVPGLVVDVKRAEWVELDALDRDGKVQSFRAVGHAARVIQHEIDHLDGRTILDRASPVKRKQYLRRRKREAKGRR